MSEQRVHSANPVNAQPQLVEQTNFPIIKCVASKAARISRTQAAIIAACDIVGSVSYVICVLIFASVWLGVNVYSERHGLHAFDPLPFSLLQGVLGLNGVLIIIALLLRHHRTHKFHHTPLEHRP